jgi:predicted MPP superfamily phosphohydrolase
MKEIVWSFFPLWAAVLYFRKCALSKLWLVAIQLTDRTSYNQKPGSLALRLTQFYSDIYMRRAFRSSVLGKQPDQIIFLGDLLDGGPILAPVE